MSFTQEEYREKIIALKEKLDVTIVAHFYQSITSQKALTLFLKKLMQQPSVCFDTETTGLDPIIAELVGISFAWEAHKGYYIPFPEDKNEAQTIFYPYFLFFFFHKFVRQRIFCVRTQ